MTEDKTLFDTFSKLDPINLKHNNTRSIKDKYSIISLNKNKKIKEYFNNIQKKNKKREVISNWRFLENKISKRKSKIIYFLASKDISLKFSKLIKSNKAVKIAVCSKKLTKLIDACDVHIDSKPYNEETYSSIRYMLESFQIPHLLNLNHDNAIDLFKKCKTLSIKKYVIKLSDTKITLKQIKNELDKIKYAYCIINQDYLVRDEENIANNIQNSLNSFVQYPIYAETRTWKLKDKVELILFIGNDNEKEFCKHCGGKGYIYCEGCQGHGNIGSDPCEECNGEGSFDCEYCFSDDEDDILNNNEIVKIKDNKLEVSEGRFNDLSIVSIHSDCMSQLGINSGDYVEIKGKRCTYARAYSIASYSKSTTSIIMNMIILSNAKTLLGEYVKVKKAKLKEAKKVILEYNFDNFDLARIIEVMRWVAVKEGDIALDLETAFDFGCIKNTNDGYHGFMIDLHKVMVKKVIPSGCGYISDKTEIIFKKRGIV
jgi:hypothetical protein